MTQLQTLYGPLEARLRADGSIFFHTPCDHYLTVGRIPHRIHLTLSSPDLNGRRGWVHDGSLDIERMDCVPVRAATDSCVRKIRAELERHAPFVDHPRGRLEAELEDVRHQQVSEERTRADLLGRLKTCEERARTLEARARSRETSQTLPPRALSRPPCHPGSESEAQPRPNSDRCSDLRPHVHTARNREKTMPTTQRALEFENWLVEDTRLRLNACERLEVLYLEDVQRKAEHIFTVVSRATPTGSSHHGPHLP